MSDSIATLVLVPFCGEVLALDLRAFEEARARGREIIPTATPATAPAEQPEITDANGMQERTSIPASWWAEAARRGAVPHIRAGKYVRYDVAAVLRALAGTHMAERASKAITRRRAQ